MRPRKVFPRAIVERLARRCFTTGYRRGFAAAISSQFAETTEKAMRQERLAARRFVRKQLDWYDRQPTLDDQPRKAPTP